METDHIIQTLYDQVNLKEMFEACIKTEHNYSILYNYSLNIHFYQLDIVMNYSENFEDLFIKIVKPMESDLRRLLIQYKLVNEGELFCSDFKYRFTDQKSRDFMGFLGKSNEETLEDIHKQLDKIIKVYRAIFNQYVQEKTQNVEKKDKFKKEISKTLYMVSYLHHLNEQSQDIKQRFEETDHKKNFNNLWDLKK